MAKYRNKPTEVDAIQWTGHNWQEVAAFMGGRAELSDLGHVIVEVYGGWEFHAESYDWILKKWDGSFECLRPHVFEKLYEAVSDEI